MAKKKMLILGATGMAGHVAFHYLKGTNQYEISNIVFRTPLNNDSIIVDVKDKNLLLEAIKNINPDVIVNCIGVLIKGSKSDPSNAIYINSLLPHLLSSIAKTINAKLIHISTDCVFSGKKGMYSEEDFRDADDVYGRSKALGEIVNDRDLTIRTSIIGPELKENGEGLFHWFMNQTGEINGFTKAIWGGITTLELAKVIHESIKQNITGLLNVTNCEKISKYDLLHLIKTVYKRENVNILKVEGKHVDKSLISVRKDFSYNVSSYLKMIEEQRQFMIEYGNEINYPYTY
ncbi:dTDP-4-dehydrorhamnose reductase family protein [Marinifilum flexuosum]|uniref:dTDP-4-dehydrorhamnose reductase n=1 Tax=Marinifilum flexuosum TaxID=1117708 RepID=A0A419XA20_9BACT|nr:SDR family oxidoreductase [Marinifilum flexuosum]RKE04607.1 dTDP-4-dehydrorhamnose reductase [Marinifilum flexuosum]